MNKVIINRDLAIEMLFAYMNAKQIKVEGNIFELALTPVEGYDPDNLDPKDFSDNVTYVDIIPKTPERLLYRKMDMMFVSMDTNLIQIEGTPDRLILTSAKGYNPDYIDPDDYPNDTAYLNAIPGMKEKLLSSKSLLDNEFEDMPEKYIHPNKTDDSEQTNTAEN